ncbi:MAG: glycosyltransferase family 2 protein [Polyangiaceae bacterium]|nr:glycosyltransferase family 2 protein [Polyangiaceae bacterium]
MTDVPCAPFDVRAYAPESSQAWRSAAAGSWLARACVIIPAYNAEKALRTVIDDLRAQIPELGSNLFVVDDGSRDATAAVAAELGCVLISHGKNRGKGAALRAGFTTALARGHHVALTVDADAQHPAEQARRVLMASSDPQSLVLGIRDLRHAGAPRKNQMSNGISNFFISRFAGRLLCDTQCGLRRYPIERTLALGARGEGFDFEAEVLLRAVWCGVPIVEEPVSVLYPPDRVTHFHVVRDPWRIVCTVVTALGERKMRTRARTVIGA